MEKYDKNDLPPCSAIIGCFKIEGNTKNSNSKWFFGPIGNIITKYIHFQEPIINIPGHQSVTYRLETIDKKLLKRNGMIEEPIRERIKKELKKLKL